ncbi:MAG: hypothetical protein HQ548_06830 [Chloroflexi bacterium]|nr:hypothetical protein [Chloroflexota bacterium]
MNWTTTVVGIAGIIGALAGVGVGLWASTRRIKFLREEGVRQRVAEREERVTQRLAELRQGPYVRMREGLASLNADCTKILVRLA